MPQIVSVIIPVYKVEQYIQRCWNLLLHKNVMISV